MTCPTQCPRGPYPKKKLSKLLPLCQYSLNLFYMQHILHINYGNTYRPPCAHKIIELERHLALAADLNILVCIFLLTPKPLTDDWPILQNFPQFFILFYFITGTFSYEI